MSFDVAAEAYTRFMGRFSEPLAYEFAERVAVRPEQRVLDVGCGPGALTAELVRRVGPAQVAAIDPSASFVAAARERFPEVDVREGRAEQLPFPDASFDVALAQLVVHFMTDPVAGLAEMGRVTRPGGAVGACVWDHAGDAGPLSLFWRAVHDLDPEAQGEAGLAGVAQGQLLDLCRAAGPARRRGIAADGHPGLRGPSTTGGIRSRSASDRPARTSPGSVPMPRPLSATAAQQLLPPAPFEVTASAWCVLARR